MGKSCHRMQPGFFLVDHSRVVNYVEVPFLAVTFIANFYEFPCIRFSSPSRATTVTIAA